MLNFKVTQNFYFVADHQNIYIFTFPYDCLTYHKVWLRSDKIHNGLLVYIPEKTIRRLQVVQNNAARLLMRVRKTEHITPILNDLHWLPINKRISYKILTMVQNALHSPVAPGYLREHVIVYRPARPLRSATNHWTLDITRSRQKHGDRSFSVAGPKLWNTLPVELSVPPTLVVFKKKLKTFLFRNFYSRIFAIAQWTELESIYFRNTVPLF